MAVAQDVGDLVRVSALFSGFSGAAEDPDVVKFVVRTPAGVETTYTYPVGVTRDSVGVYVRDVSLDAAGLWWIRSQGTGGVVAADEVSILVASQRAVGT